MHFVYFEAVELPTSRVRSKIEALVTEHMDMDDDSLQWFDDLARTVHIVASSAHAIINTTESSTNISGDQRPEFDMSHTPTPLLGLHTLRSIATNLQVSSPRDVPTPVVGMNALCAGGV